MHREKEMFGNSIVFREGFPLLRSCILSREKCLRCRFRLTGAFEDQIVVECVWER